MSKKKVNLVEKCKEGWFEEEFHQKGVSTCLINLWKVVPLKLSSGHFKLKPLLSVNARDNVCSLIQEDSIYCGATKPFCNNYWAPTLEPMSCNYWSPHALETMLHNQRIHRNEKPLHCNLRVVPPPQLEKSALRQGRPRSNTDPAKPKIKLFFKFFKINKTTKNTKWPKN